MLIDKGVCTADEWADYLAVEADELNKMLERRFPGIRATDKGITMTAEAEETMKGWKP